MIKPSYKTSEFWFTVVSFVFSGFYLLGIIGDFDQKEELISVVSHAVESCFLIIGQFTIFYKYMKSRESEKIEYEKRKTKEQENISKEIEDYVGVDRVVIKVNINTGGVGDLIQLPHIGVATAQKIIDYRKENGDFESVKQLKKVAGIGESTYEEIKKYITI